MHLKVDAAHRPPPIADVGDGGGWQFETRALAPDFKHFEVRSLASSNPTVSIFDYIGDDGNGGGVSSSRVAAALRSIGAKPLTVEINSPGGNYFEGVAIYNLLRRHSAPVAVQVLGIAASAASVIAMAGDTIAIAHNAEIMIHQSRGLFYGTADEMTSATSVLQRIDQAMADTYAARTKRPVAEMAAWMRAETYMQGAVAVERGFADTVMEREAQPPVYADASASHPRDPQSLDRMLAKAGMARGARRELFRAIKGDAPSTPTPDLAARNRARIAALTKGL
ncbi:head maturation protease, ClpP-related [Sphingobium sp.]|uniref:head maturation protease, ClpP-related n=1 Tax=Sphingobium sp. TaxID=1912891 RepID=UPI003BB7D092